MAAPTTQPTIVVTRRWPESVEEQLRETYPNVVLSEDDEPLGEEGLREALRTADVLLPNVSDQLTAELLLAPDVRTRFIGNYGVGFSNIDIEAARQANIVVSNTPGVLTETTADLAIALFLMVARRAGEGERHVRRAEWSGWRPTHMVGADVTGKTLGVLGMGRIGSAVARKAYGGFDMSIIWFDSSENATCDVPGSRRLGTIHEVLARADFVSLHMPGGGENVPLIGARELEAMKETAYLINTARGDVVDQIALVHALRHRAIAGAGLDVFEHEPNVPNDLLELENVVLLPHLGSNSLETRTAMGDLVLKNLAAFLAGEEPPCRVA